MKRPKWLVLLITLLLVNIAYADQKGDALLKKVEDVILAAKDQTATIKMTTLDKSDNSKVRTIVLKQMGRDLRLIKFIKPADVKGVGFLVKSDDEMYLFMPEFGKVRRIASHVKNDNFMGTDFSYNDMASVTYVEDYQAAVTKEEGGIIHLSLVPRKPKSTEYSKLIMFVDKSNNVPTKIEFYDKSGKLWKVMTQENIKQITNYWVSEKIVMKDIKANHSTTMELGDVKFDTGLREKDFSKRKLKRSR